MIVETKFDISQTVYPIVRLVSGRWYLVDARDVRSITLKKHPYDKHSCDIVYNCGGTTYPESEVFSTSQEAIDVCSKYNANVK